MPGGEISLDVTGVFTDPVEKRNIRFIKRG
jgi:hypothetical protein